MYILQIICSPWESTRIDATMTKQDSEKNTNLAQKDKDQINCILNNFMWNKTSGLGVIGLYSWKSFDMLEYK